MISKALIDSVIIHDEFGLIKNVLKEYSERNERRNQKFKHLIKFIKDFSPFTK